jgi:ABC-2 type transport system ATP-binding protein
MRSFSVVMSSHLLHDLERVCDHLILLTASRTQLCDDIDDVLATHRVLLAPRRKISDVEPGRHGRQGDADRPGRRVLLVRLNGPVIDPGLGGHGPWDWRTSSWPTWNRTTHCSRRSDD